MAQFGDIRFETQSRTIVVEIESAGGISNLLKYWPYLLGKTQRKPKKPFIFVHLYNTKYPTHSALWHFFVDNRPTFIVQVDFLLLDNAVRRSTKVIATIASLVNAG